MSAVADYIGERGRHGVQLLPDRPEIFSLIFADDVALIATTPVALQNQLNSLSSISRQQNLSINRDKTKIMVFRRGGFLARSESWESRWDNTRGCEQIQIPWLFLYNENVAYDEP